MFDLSQENLEFGSETNSSLFEISLSITLKRPSILSGIGVSLCRPIANVLVILCLPVGGRLDLPRRPH
jgi:hypothetical protein